MSTPDFMFGVLDGSHIIYDIETYPNVFTMQAKQVENGITWTLEISNRVNDMYRLRDFIYMLREHECKMVGYNNIGFDYPVIHFIMTHIEPGLFVNEIYTKAMSIIEAHGPDRYGHLVWESDHIVEQIDLYKIHHFDNPSKATSLKALEFAMRMDNIEDLPFDVGIELTDEQIDVLLEYNLHDESATEEFYHESAEEIQLRRDLGEKYDKNFMNMSDTKIGSEIFVDAIEKAAPGTCFSYKTGRKEKRQTPRCLIKIGEIVLPYVNQYQFTQPEFSRMRDYFNQLTIKETKGALTGLSCTVRGVDYVFGTGGLHASVESCAVSSDSEWIIEDWDVASYYPNLAISNNLYPEHLGTTFCEVYKNLYQERRSHPKGSAMNAALKLALNGTYGNSNNKYSPLYDPQYTMAITVNGQLSLCVLIDALSLLDTMQVIQANTDGITIKYPREQQQWVHSVMRWWEQYTNLELECVEYDRMFIRDVNNYIAVDTKGAIKRKGAYENKLPGERQPKGWHQDTSALIVAKAAEAVLVGGADLDEYIRNHDNMFDFYLRAKVSGKSYLTWGGEHQGRIVRYYVSTSGDYLEKVMPPTGPEGQYKKAARVPEDVYQQWHAHWGNVHNPEIHTKNQSKHSERRTMIHGGQTVMVANRITTHDKPADVDYNFYINEALKLINPVR